MVTLAALFLSLASGNLPISDPGAAPASATTQLANAFATTAAVVGSSSAGYRATGTAELVKPHTPEPHIANGVASKSDPAEAAAATGLNANIFQDAQPLPKSANTAEGDGHHGFPLGSMLPLLGFAVCGAAALVFARKKQATPRLLEIVETHSLGGRRSLIVARIAGETLLLGSSEGGLSLLLARPGEFAAQPEAAMLAANPAQIRTLDALGDSPGAAPCKRPERVGGPAGKSAAKTKGDASSSWLGRLRLAHTPDPSDEGEPSFEDLLARDAQNRAQSRSRGSEPTAEPEPALLRQPLDPLAESAEDLELRRKLSQGRSGRIG